LTAGLLRGVDLLDLGARRLRDITHPVQVFQVRALGLRTEFLPLRAVDAVPGNLRAAGTSFIGRETEIGELQEALKAHRLVTLTGAGGVGKTRLAVEVAARLADQFLDGVWFFDLAAVTDLEAVPDAVAGVLGIIQQPGKTVTESVAAALEGRVRLLVMDNCEHVLDAVADVVEAILAASATVTILATSREGLGVADEQQWRVPSLDVRSGPESAAVALFLDRAHSVVSDFARDQPGQAEAVVEICRRLDGIPLAIELAASRMASMSAAEVRDRLDDRFRLLVGSRRSLSRHQTLRHAVAWSYDLLSEDEKLLLDRCSVFTGGFDLESICAVADSGDEYRVLDHLDALVRKSILVADHSSGHTRYLLLETIRQFAEDQLIASGQANETRTRHARYFAGREPDIMALWDSPRQRDAYDWLSIEMPNLRTAFRWAADHDDLDTAANIAFLAAFLASWLIQYEPLGWAEGLLDRVHAVGHRRLAQLYVAAAIGCDATGQIEESLRYIDAARAAIDSGDYEPMPHRLEVFGGLSYLDAGQPERLIEWGQATLAEDGDAEVAPWILLVFVLTVVGRGDEARVTVPGLVDAAEHTRNPALLSYALWAEGFAFGNAEPSHALQSLRRGLVIAQDCRNTLVAGTLASTLSRLETQYGDPLVALDCLTLAIRSFHDAGNTTQIVGPLANLASLFDRLERYEPAAVIAGFASTTVVPGLTKIEATVNHLREVLGNQAYESLASAGDASTLADVATYAFEQIDQARVQLPTVSE
ncbi:MAG TPA: NB-ARC domain-containing protein, partial [Ilumatobacteraceae bacterium]|nr:NB-ARC domain-containing protein [Ilumatobacteraceae bacterium]